MKNILHRYKGVFLLAFLLLFVSAIDRYILAGNYTGTEGDKHIYFIGILVVGVLTVIAILLSGESKEE